MNADEARINKMDQDKINRYKAWIGILKKDIYLDETVDIVNNMILQQKLVKKN